MPGAGKTVLLSIVTDHLQKACPDVLVLVVYCRYHDKLSERDIFAALLMQVVDSGAEDLELSAVQSFYDTNTRQKITPSAPTFLDLLDTLFRRFQKVSISIDALDEICDEAKEELFAALSQLRASCFITSRPLNGFRELLSSTQTLQLEDALLENNDIEFFIQTKINTIRCLMEMCQGNVDLRIKICDKLKAKSAGMFLLCALQVNSLRRVTTVKKLWDAIETLPTGINDMYRVTWGRILSQEEYEVDLARRAIVFIAYAKRTLASMELRHPFAISIDRWTMDPDDILGIDVLVAVCCGLVVVDEGNNVVRLAHYTTHDFILELGSSDVYPDPHRLFAMTCLTHLSASGFPEKFMTWDKLRPLPHVFDQDPDSFLMYSYNYWGHHARDLEHPGPLPNALLAILRKWTKYPIVCSYMTVNRHTSLHAMNFGTFYP